MKGSEHIIEVPCLGPVLLVFTVIIILAAASSQEDPGTLNGVSCYFTRVTGSQTASQQAANQREKPCPFLFHERYRVQPVCRDFHPEADQ